MAKITVIFPLYQASDKVEGLLGCLVAQRHPDFQKQADWMEVIFIDNASTDSTIETLEAAIERLIPRSEDRGHLRIIRNENNLGLSRSLNKAFGLTRTPYGLTCHSDVRFAQPDYVAKMLDLMERHPEAGAITGQTAIDPGRPLSLTEKVYLVANLMDIFPPKAADELVPVGFAEGRCDVFRIAALRAVGMYDTTLRLAGEDQILAARMREKGFEVYQAPSCAYYLSVSVQQDTLGKLIKHARLFGRAHPYIMLTQRGTRHGIATERAGANRRARTFLRMWQLACVALYFVALIALAAGFSVSIWLGALALAFAVKAVMFRKHSARVRLSLKETAVFYLYQPILDISYSIGIAQGFWHLMKDPRTREIA